MYLQNNFYLLRCALLTILGMASYLPSLLRWGKIAFVGIEKKFLKVDSSEVSSGAVPLDSPLLALGLSPAAAGGR